MRRHGHIPRGARLLAAVAVAVWLASAPGADGSKITRPAAELTAHAAGTVSLNESGHLRLTSKHSFTLNERGAASGTFAGAIYVHLTIVSTSRVTAEVNIYPNGGSVSGYASASYRRGAQTASFSGSMSIARGSGSYAHVHGSNLSFSGTIQRANDAVTVQMSGRISV